MITISSTGNFQNTEAFLKHAGVNDIYSLLRRYGQVGVMVLAQATPVDSGLTATSWSYEVLKTSTSVSLVWKNNNVVSGVPVAILIQVGHATKNGGYVSGRDFINPVIQPIFDQIAATIWKEVTR